MVLYCDSCGTRADSEDKYCRECGSVIRTSQSTDPSATKQKKRQSVAPRTLSNASLGSLKEHKDGAASSSTSSTPTSSPPSSKESSPASSFLGGDNPKKSKRSSHRARCAKCEEVIATSTKIRALGKEWHHKCFNCVKCGADLSGGFFPHEGQPYCERDYEEQYLKKCTVCKKTIDGVYFDDRRGGYYHSQCFKCQTCGVALSSSFYWNDNKIACETCGQKQMKQVVISPNDKCSQCNRPIVSGDRIVAMEFAKLHEQCFQCYLCGKLIGSNTYTFSPFETEKFICMSCVQGGKVDACEKCGQVIATARIHALGKKYHEQCFKCNICFRIIPPNKDFFFSEKSKEPVCADCRKTATKV